MSVSEEDVVKLMLQHCRENNWFSSMEALCADSGFYLDAVESTEGLAEDIANGEWPGVLRQLRCVRLPYEVVSDIYEQMLLELLEEGSPLVAEEMLLSTKPLLELEQRDRKHYMKLKTLCDTSKKTSKFEHAAAYVMGVTKAMRRQELAAAVTRNLVNVPNSRLVIALGKSLQHSSSSSGDKRQADIDLFTGRKRVRLNEDEKPITKICAQIPFERENRSESVAFHPVDGMSVALGYADGYIEMRSVETGALREDLIYQKNDGFCRHDGNVLALAFSKSGDLLASGCSFGAVKVWKVMTTGTCLQQFLLPSTKGISCIDFANNDVGCLLVGCLDGTLRMLGIRSGNVLTQYLGHTGYVNDCCLSPDDSILYSASSDGFLRCWDTKTSECLYSTQPGASSASAQEVAVMTVQIVPPNNNHQEKLFITTRGNGALFVRAQDGEVLSRYNSSSVGEMQCAALSARGHFVYCVGDKDGEIEVHDTTTLQLHSMVRLSLMNSSSSDGAAGARKGTIATFHHPHRNLLVTLGESGVLRIWCP